MFDVWKNVLSELEQSIPESLFSTWFTNVKLRSIEDGIITIEVPNIFKETQIKKKYNEQIKAAFSHNEVDFRTINYVVSNNTKIRSRAREISIDDLNKKKSKKVTREPRQALKSFSTGLRPDYTMDNFVVGSNNDLAVAVAKNVIKDPGGKYNPFFLYGGPGLGKTHLVQAIGNELLKSNPDLKVLYKSTDHFFSEFIDSIRNNRGDSFSQKYQKVDVLIIDDIQMIVGKDASQQAFFNIFNDFYQQGRQIIVTSDRLPEQIKTLDERLSSRLAWAGAYDLQLPSFEDKCAILKAKAEFDGVEIEDEAVEYIAKNVKTNIRDLEKEYKMVLAWAELKNISPLEVINEGLQKSSSNSKVGLISSKQLVEEVARYYDLTTKEMCGKSRVAHIKNARQVAMYLLSEELGMSTTKIALEVGVKDHTTVMHGIKKIKGDLKLDFALREQIAGIREKLYV